MLRVLPRISDNQYRLLLENHTSAICFDRMCKIWNSVIALIQNNPHPPFNTIQTPTSHPTNTQSYNVGFLINCCNNSWWSLTCSSGIVFLNDFIFCDSPLNRSHLWNSIISLPIGNSAFWSPADCWLVCYWKAQYIFCYIFIEIPLNTM